MKSTINSFLSSKIVMKGKINISVGIITFNRPETLKLVLKALEAQTKQPYEILVVDNSTNFATKNLMKKFLAKRRLRRQHTLKYHYVKERIFQPHARNMILKKCNGNVIAFLDDDAVPEPQWLAAIEECFSDKTVVGATGPALNCIEPGNPTEKIITSGKNRNYFTSCGDVRSDSRRWIPPASVGCTIMLGANMSFRTELLKRIGFDEFYGKDAAFREETDPQVALIKQGFRFVYNPSAVVWHMKFSKGGIRSNPPENYYYYCGVNHRHFADKYFPKWKSRLSWIFFSLNPPCLWIALGLSVMRRDKSLLKWHKGLWARKKFS